MHAQPAPWDALASVLTRIDNRLGKLEARPQTTPTAEPVFNEVGKKRARVRDMLDSLRDEPTMVSDEDEPKPKRRKFDMMEAVRQYYDGSRPLTDRQHLVRLELSKLPLDSIAAFFGALRRVASTIEAEEGEYRRFTETMTHTEQMVHDLFGEAVRRQSMSAGHRDGLEAKFVTLLKGKMLAMKEFNFVKAAADAQQTIMKEVREVRPDVQDRRRDDRRPGGVPTCFECGRKGHKSFECKASEEDRKAHKERRAAARG